jgi:hypothetical protein
MGQKLAKYDDRRGDEDDDRGVERVASEWLVGVSL